MRNVVTRTYQATDYITVAELKTHLRVTSSSDDTYIGNLLASVFDIVSKHLGYEVRKSTVDYFFAETFQNKLHIPARLLSVTSVSYRDTNGDLQTLASTDYDEVLTLSANYGYDIEIIDAPDLYSYGWKYKATVVEGFAKVGDSVDVSKIFPEGLRSAIYVIAEDLYTQRGSIVVGVSVTNNDLMDTLLSPYAIKEFV